MNLEAFKNWAVASCGVYRILVLQENGWEPVYIGESKNVLGRLKRHYHDLAAGRHRNKHLQNVCNKHGLSNMRFEQIMECPNKTQALAKELEFKNIYPGLCNQLIGEESHHIMSRDVIERAKAANRSTFLKKHSKLVKNLKQVAKEHGEGRSLRKLAKQYNVERRTLARLLRDYGYVVNKNRVGRCVYKHSSGKGFIASVCISGKTFQKYFLEEMQALSYVQSVRSSKL